MCTLRHREPDKVPIDLNGTNCTSLTRIAYNNLRKYLNLTKDIRPNISTKVMDSVRASEDILEIYKIDTRSVYMGDPLASDGETCEDGSFEDVFGIRWKPASYYYDAVERPLKEGTVSELKKARWEDIYNRDKIKGLREKTKWLYENTSYCLVTDIHSMGPFEGGCMLRVYDNFLIDLASNQKYAEALLDKLTESAIVKWEMLLNEVGEYVQVVASGDDVGM